MVKDKINQISDRSKFIEIRNPQYQRYERSEISEIRDLRNQISESLDIRLTLYLGSEWFWFQTDWQTDICDSRVAFATEKHIYKAAKINFCSGSVWLSGVLQCCFHPSRTKDSGQCSSPPQAGDHRPHSARGQRRLLHRPSSHPPRRASARPPRLGTRRGGTYSPLGL